MMEKENKKEINWEGECKKLVEELNKNSELLGQERDLKEAAEDSERQVRSKFKSMEEEVCHLKKAVRVLQQWMSTESLISMAAFFADASVNKGITNEEAKKIEKESVSLFLGKKVW